MDNEYAPIPSLLALSAVHNHLIREKTRNQVALIVESGEPREVMHFALLLVTARAPSIRISRSKRSKTAIAPARFPPENTWDKVYLRMEAKDRDLSKWEDIVHRVYNPKDTVTIGIVGKYVEYEDSSKSLKEALVHGALAHNLKLQLNWIEAEGLETGEGNSNEAQLDGYDGLLVPGGFGKRGIEGMLIAIRYARENKVPYFGICLGMQTACVEFARNVVGLADANSSEFDQATPHRVIYKLRELRGVEELGGTMRLGAWTCKIEPNTLAHKIYGKLEISERHRHRYEFNREYEEPMVAAGLRISGSTPDGTYVEMIELPDHPHFIGCQFHPEFKSKPLEPHPLFSTFIAAAYEHGTKRRAQKETAAVEMFHRPEKVTRR